MSPHTTSICVLILLCMCPHTTWCVSSYHYLCVLILLCTMCVFILKYTMYAFSYYYVLYVSSYYYTTVSGSVFPGVRNERDICQKRYAVSRSRLRPSATSVWGLKLLVAYIHRYISVCFQAYVTNDTMVKSAMQCLDLVLVKDEDTLVSTNVAEEFKVFIYS
jgi:hypothetical protein